MASDTDKATEGEEEYIAFILVFSSSSIDEGPPQKHPSTKAEQTLQMSDPVWTPKTKNRLS